MTDKIYITNKTGNPIVATIFDDFTGGDIYTYKLNPGSNEILVTNLHEGIYTIQLEDSNHDIFYKQQLVRA